MFRVQKTALIRHSAMEMFDLVKDVARYPEFLPWCQATKVLKEAPQEICAEIVVARLGITQAFSTCNRYVEGQWMSIELHTGPFYALNGKWRFEPLRVDACKFSLDLEFTFSNMLIAQTFGNIFHYAANSLVDAFCIRADNIYPIK